MFDLDLQRQPWQVMTLTADEFLIGMSDIGFVQEMSMVGAFAEDPDDQTHPWADVMACVRYLATGLQAKLGLRRYRFGMGDSSSNSTAPVPYHGYGTPTRDRRCLNSEKMGGLYVLSVVEMNSTVM